MGYLVSRQKCAARYVTYLKQKSNVGTFESYTNASEKSGKVFHGRHIGLGLGSIMRGSTPQTK